MSRSTFRRISPGSERRELIGMRFPDEVEEFAHGMCMHFRRKPRFWCYRKPSERLDRLETLILDLVVLRCRQRHFWGRHELEGVVGHSAGTTSNRYARLDRLRSDAPTIWRASHKLEGALAPKFIEQLIEEDTSEFIMEACEQIRSLRNL